MSDVFMHHFMAVQLFGEAASILELLCSLYTFTSHRELHNAQNLRNSQNVPYNIGGIMEWLPK